MTLKNYMKHLVTLLEENPEAADFQVVTAKDDEGNGYDRVHFTPGLGVYDDEFGEFSPLDPEDEEQEAPNAVLLN